MLAVVVPARNEAPRIQDALRQVLRLPVGLVIPVLNGCTDMTPELVRRLADRRIQPLPFEAALGYDVPRIAGARAALSAGALGVLFVDGDLTGPIEPALNALIQRLKRGADLVLTDCYHKTPTPTRRSTAARVYQARMALNQALERPDLGPAIPSHGPVGVSRRLLEQVSPVSPGIPPLMQAEAVRRGLQVEVGALLAHRDLGSAERQKAHRALIADTIIGDCMQAVAELEGRGTDRGGFDGYHSQRRFDLVGLEAPAGVS